MARCTRLVCALVLLAGAATLVTAGPEQLPAPQKTTTDPQPSSTTSGPQTPNLPPPTVPSLPPPPTSPVPSLMSRLKSKIKTSTPAKELLPLAPKSKSRPVYLGNDLTQVPEIVLATAPDTTLTTEKWTERIAQALANADHLNSRQTDGYIKSLVKERGDLAGLPFLLGDACRMKSGRSASFQSAALALRKFGEKDARKMSVLVGAFDAVAENRDGEVAIPSSTDKKLREHMIQARVAAVTQMMGPTSPDIRLGVVKYLSGIPRLEATHHLAKLAVFSPERSVREAAIEALSVRRERDYTEPLVQALRYPWLAVASNAADAIVKLERKDLIPQLVDILDEPDPREPKTETINEKKVHVTRELVKINHHKSCLLCHAPAEPEKVRGDSFTAEVPLPSEDLPSGERGYNQRNSNLLVRIDVTYLRQDFSMMQPVKDAEPWPESQRFDFLVRKRILSESESKELHKKLNQREEGELSPYHRAAVKALRELTGKDVEAKASAWRKLLKLPAKRDS